MKNLLYLFFTSLFIISCSSDSTTENNETALFEIPFETNNYWTYNIEDTSLNTGRDSLFVGNDTVINAITYKKMKVRDNQATGFFSNSLRNNGARVQGNKLYISGDFSANLGQTNPLNFNLVLDEFIAFDADAPIDGNPSVRTGSFQQTVSTFPLTINYTLKSVGGQSYSNYTSPNGDTYTNVKSGKIILNLTITTTQVLSGIPITVYVLPQQDVLVSEQFVAKNIGVVHTHTQTSYALNSQLPASILNSLTFPTSYNSTQNEYLDDYLVN
ncbi:conserved hypothetical protein [Flavobacterium sp. 9AF]|uniref:hypothetical protein n=1 Tax=Flavobacterium sp. 9AF TaxID=2653142 RepID=UPI0012EF61D1|nr:hypothetical protein [Flavobacterium sp. 9AF]VXB62889.1 conserved hypothetical protein [Flavobacterium sp. 9AF]